ncbi:MAG TPA: hypothetical protein V6C71_27280 [Coleofasciculaceae cyanobacterium]|jgi:hypothetical protein
MKSLSIRRTGIVSFLFLSLAFSNTIGCIREDRTTIVYGRVIDEARQPVDSILVRMYSAGFAKPGLPLGHTHTDKDGNYTLVIDVPKGYNSTTVYIPENINTKFSENYKDYLVYQDGQQLGNCCGASIGKKTNYDFLLLSK